MTALLGCAAAYLLGVLILRIADFIDAGDGRTNTIKVGNLFTDLGSVAAGVALVWMGVESSGSSLGVRITLIVLGVLLAFHAVLKFGLTGGISS
jgi:hypothetical protein